jgi:hypothetical protein
MHISQESCILICILLYFILLHLDLQRTSFEPIFSSPILITYSLLTTKWGGSLFRANFIFSQHISSLFFGPKSQKSTVLTLRKNEIWSFPPNRATTAQFCVGPSTLHLCIPLAHTQFHHTSCAGALNQRARSSFWWQRRESLRIMRTSLTGTGSRIIDREVLSERLHALCCTRKVREGEGAPSKTWSGSRLRDPKRLCSRFYCFVPDAGSLTEPGLTFTKRRPAAGVGAPAGPRPFCDGQHGAKESGDRHLCTKRRDPYARLCTLRRRAPRPRSRTQGPPACWAGGCTPQQLLARFSVKSSQIPAHHSPEGSARQELSLARRTLRLQFSLNISTLQK